MRDTASLQEGGGSDPYLELLSEAYSGQRATTASILGSARDPAALHRLVEDAMARAGRCVREALRIDPPARAVACGKGCQHCCWATVGVLGPEVLFLAEGLRARLPEMDLELLKEASAGRARELLGRDRGGRLEARLPCALLQEGCCSAYPHRPLACRWAVSPSLPACLDHLVHRTSGFVKMEETLSQPIQQVWLGLRTGLRDLGLDGSLLALNGALAIALAEPEAARRYLAGEPVFQAVSLE